MYSLAVAGFVMLGAKLVQRFGATRVFRVVVALFGIGAGADDVQPGRDRDAGGPGPDRPLRGGDRACAGRADRQPLSRPAAGDRRGRLGIGARRRRRRRVPDRRAARHVHRLASRVRAPDRGLGDRVLPELPAEAGRRPEGCGDRPRGRGAGRGRHHPDQLRLQQPQPLGPRRGAARRTLRPLRPVARAGDDRDRHRAAAGLHRLDPAAAGGRQDPAARPPGHHVGPGTRGGVRAVRRRRARGDAQLLGAALHPDHPGPHADRDRHRDAALQPHGVLHGDAGRAALRQDAPRSASGSSASSSARWPCCGSPGSCATTGARPWS